MTLEAFLPLDDSVAISVFTRLCKHFGLPLFLLSADNVSLFVLQHSDSVLRRPTVSINFSRCHCRHFCPEMILAAFMSTDDSIIISELELQRQHFYPQILVLTVLSADDIVNITVLWCQH
jgi:hypothetical protein